VQLHAFVISATDGRCGQLHFKTALSRGGGGEDGSLHPLRKNLVAPTAGLDVSEKAKTYQCQESNPNHSVV
jgi:hypothetical protein